MTQQQGIHDIIAALEHYLAQLERDARKWEGVATEQRQQIAALEHERDGLETYASEMEWHRRAAARRARAWKRAATHYRKDARLSRLAMRALLAAREGKQVLE